MTVNQVLQLDCREEENWDIIQEELKKIKPLSKCQGNVPFEKIEKLITVISKKYDMSIKEFTPDVWSNSNGTIWRAIIINNKNLKVIEKVYGLSVYEVFAKSAIWMYSAREEVGRRGESK